MQWRVRTTMVDRPGLLADLARACGASGVNILGMQVFPVGQRVTDELVVEAPDGWTDLEVATLFEQAGGADVAVTRADDTSAQDMTTRYLTAVHQVLDEGRDVEEVLAELLETTPPDVAHYAGHDVLDLRRRDGSTLRVSRAVPFTSVERARAQALVSLLGEAGAPVPLIAPSQTQLTPLLRLTTPADVEAVIDLHGRCSAETLYDRYQVPLRAPLTPRLARRLATPENGYGVAVQVGLDLVGHGVLDPTEEGWTFQLLVEDAWQGRGLGTMLVKHAAGRAKGLHAEHMTLISAGSNDKLLRTVGNAGFVARVVRHEGNVHITVPLTRVRPILEPTPV